MVNMGQEEVLNLLNVKITILFLWIKYENSKWKTKIIKYKVANTNIDKRFINKELDLQTVKSKSSCAQPFA